MEPAQLTSQAEPEATSTLASKPAEANKGDKAKGGPGEEMPMTHHSDSAREQSSEAAAPNSEALDVTPVDQTSSSESEETSASAPQAAEGGVEIVDLPKNEGIEGSESIGKGNFCCCFF